MTRAVRSLPVQTRAGWRLAGGGGLANPRFVSGTGTESDCMIDKLTGLMWPKNGNLAGEKRRGSKHLIIQTAWTSAAIQTGDCLMLLS